MTSFVETHASLMRVIYLGLCLATSTITWLMLKRRETHNEPRWVKMLVLFWYGNLIAFGGYLLGVTSASH